MKTLHMFGSQTRVNKLQTFFLPEHLLFCCCSSDSETCLHLTVPLPPGAYLSQLEVYGSNH